MFLIVRSYLFIWIYCFLYMGIPSNGGELPACPASFITSIVCNRSGDIWVATEGKGLMRLPYGGEKWEQQKGNGLPDTTNFYALLEDRQGRIWVGTDNKGVAVWNGKSWQQYNQSNALPGERIFAMAVSPVSGDVAIATSGGLTVYQPETESWKDYTRAEGLPEDQIASLSFDRKGTLWAAFQTSGVASAEPSNGYSRWNVVQTKWYWDTLQRVRQPFEARGKGLPSNFCNAICAESGWIWVGTNSGLGYSKNKTDWNFLRGRDYGAKNEGLWKPDEKTSVRHAQKLLKMNRRENNDDSLLPEDYITCFYPSSQGMWIGFREKGVSFVRKNLQKIQTVDMPCDDEVEKLVSVTSFASLPDGSLYAGTYGKGLLHLGHVERKRIFPLNDVKHPSFPGIGQLSELLKTRTAIDGMKKTNPPAKALFWYEDWATRGDWCERYGRSYMLLCGAAGPMGSVLEAFDNAYRCESVKGPHVKVGESGVSGKVIWENERGDENILYCPISTTRTLARWSDRGESVDRDFDGPDLGVLIQVPDKKQLLSFYFYDPTPLADNDLDNSLKDYILEIRKLPANFDFDSFLGVGKEEEVQEEDLFREPSYDGLKDYIPLPVLARSRVKSFAGCGVYKNFIVEGSGWYYVRILKNYSVSTTLNGVFISSLDETKIAVDKLLERLNQKSFYYGLCIPSPPPLNSEQASKLSSSLLKLWAASQDMRLLNGKEIFSSRKLGIYAYRHLLATQAPDEIKKNWRWRLKIWETEDRKDFRQQMKKAWASLQDTVYFYRSSEWATFAPDTTIPFSVDEVRKMSALKIDWKQYLPGSNKKPELDVQQMKEWLKNKK